MLKKKVVVKCVECVYIYIYIYKIIYIYTHTHTHTHTISFSCHTFIIISAKSLSQLSLMIMFGRNHSQSIDPPQFSELDTESLSASYDTNEEFSPLAK